MKFKEMFLNIEIWWPGGSGLPVQLALAHMFPAFWDICPLIMQKVRCKARQKYSNYFLFDMQQR